MVDSTIVSSGNTQELVQVEHTLCAERIKLGHAHEEKSSRQTPQLLLMYHLCYNELQMGLKSKEIGCGK